MKTFDPKSLPCVLCSHVGGAYKCAATETTSWVHALCSNWIPELYESANSEPKFGPLVHVERLEKQRITRLNCNHCNLRGVGAAIECFSTACHKAIHPMCLLTEDSDFTWRVVEGTQDDDSATYQRELFCPAHADKVGAAPKKESDMVIQVTTL